MIVVGIRHPHCYDGKYGQKFGSSCKQQYFSRDGKDNVDLGHKDAYKQSSGSDDGGGT